MSHRIRFIEIWLSMSILSQWCLAGAECRVQEVGSPDCSGEADLHAEGGKR